MHVAVSGGDDIDEVGVDQKRRMLEHGKRHRRLIDRQRLHDGGRRIGAARKHFGHGLANQRRSIVEQHQQRAFGRTAILLGHVGKEQRAGQRPRGLRALAGGSSAYPTDELPNDHGPAGLRNLKNDTVTRCHCHTK